MSNFPTGSKIIITKADAGEPYTNGDIFTVDSPNTPGVYVILPDGNRKYLASHEFKAYTPKQVKIIRSCYPREYSVGDILDVSERQDVCEGSIRVTTKQGSPSVPPRGDWEYYTKPAEVTFKKGDTVRLARCGDPSWNGIVGEFVENRGSLVRFRVTDTGGTHNLTKVGKVVQFLKRDVDLVDGLAEWEKELLEVTPRTIAFKDIQVGDTIKTVRTSLGLLTTREGVVTKRYGISGNCIVEGGGYISDETWSNAVYTLLERPEPEPVNPYAEAKVGSLAREIDGDYTWCKTADDVWQFIYKGQGSLSGSKRSNDWMRGAGKRFELFHVVK